MMLGERPGPRAGLKAREASFAGALSCIVVVRYNRDARRSRPPLDVFGKKRRFLCVMGAYRPLRRFACLWRGGCPSSRALRDNRSRAHLDAIGRFCGVGINRFDRIRPDHDDLDPVPDVRPNRIRWRNEATAAALGDVFDIVPSHHLDLVRPMRTFWRRRTA